MAKVAIGIDLGTSNCALEWSAFGQDPANVSTFKIRQYESESLVAESDILPSFLYFPEEAEDNGPQYHIGRFAREISKEKPDRCIHSAKSWLCHPGVDRDSSILPWQSSKIGPNQRMSPVEASAAYLKYLKTSWDNHYAKNDPDLAFEKQQVTVTVPASFDQVAQRLTLKAAKEAGFPESTRLLEEPQAAFLAWIQKPSNATKLKELQTSKNAVELKVVVCDVGGGTTDFSLFSVDPSTSIEQPEIERIAVSDHILLGGDNIDIALAKRAEMAFAADGISVRPEQWLQLVAQARLAKESVLDESDPTEIVRIVLMDTGSSLFANTHSLTWQGEDVARWIAEDFFPETHSESRPHRESGGFVEMGLPYAQDPAITVHLADFLKGQHVDAILFNGGTVSPQPLQERICSIVTEWQDGDTPLRLSGDNPYLAVARGAAHYGHRLKAQADTMIRAGAARPFLIEVQANEKEGERHLLCVLPKGATPSDSFTIKKPTFALRLDRPVQFQPFTGPDTDRMRQGQIVRWKPDQFRAMPPLQTLALSGEKLALGSVTQTEEVSLKAQLNELGLVEVSCNALTKSKKAKRSQWDLAFDIRQVLASENQLSEAEMTDADFAEKANAFSTVLSSSFNERVMKELETATDQKRGEWSLPLLRRGFDQLIDNVSKRGQSENHEVAWWMAAGYCLRPGFGAPLDDFRIQQLDALLDLGIAFPNSKAVREQNTVFWRRVAGGLGAESQERLFDQSAEVAFSGSKRGLEPLKMLAAFEDVSASRKRKILTFLQESIPVAPKWAVDSYLWCLGRVAARIPLSGKQDAVILPSDVEPVLLNILISVPESVPINSIRSLVVNSARLCGARELDLSEEARSALIAETVNRGVDEANLKPLKELVPVASKDVQNQFGEALPQGLVLV